MFLFILGFSLHTLLFRIYTYSQSQHLCHVRPRFFTDYYFVSSIEDDHCDPLNVSLCEPCAVRGHALFIDPDSELRMIVQTAQWNFPSAPVT